MPQSIDPSSGQPISPIQTTYINAVSVTPSDSTSLTTTAKALLIGGAGNVSVKLLNGSTVILNGLTAGTIYPIAVTQVNATSTTATNIVALY